MEEEALLLLKEALAAFNELPNRKVGEINTYTLASRIDKFFAAKGIEFADTRTPLIKRKQLWEP